MKPKDLEIQYKKLVDVPISSEISNTATAIINNNGRVEQCSVKDIGGNSPILDSAIKYRGIGYKLKDDTEFIYDGDPAGKHVCPISEYPEEGISLKAVRLSETPLTLEELRHMIYAEVIISEKQSDVFSEELIRPIPDFADGTYCITLESFDIGGAFYISPQEQEISGILLKEGIVLGDYKDQFLNTISEYDMTITVTKNDSVILNLNKELLNSLEPYQVISGDTKLYHISDTYVSSEYMIGSSVQMKLQMIEALDKEMIQAFVDLIVPITVPGIEGYAFADMTTGIWSITKVESVVEGYPDEPGFYVSQSMISNSEWSSEDIFISNITIGDEPIKISHDMIEEDDSSKALSGSVNFYVPAHSTEVSKYFDSISYNDNTSYIFFTPGDRQTVDILQECGGYFIHYSGPQVYLRFLYAPTENKSLYFNYMIMKTKYDPNIPG